MVRTAAARIAGKKKAVKGSIPDSLRKTIFRTVVARGCLWFALKRRSLRSLQVKLPQAGGGPWRISIARWTSGRTDMPAPWRTCGVGIIACPAWTLVFVLKGYRGSVLKSSFPPFENIRRHPSLPSFPCSEQGFPWDRGGAAAACAPNGVGQRQQENIRWESAGICLIAAFAATFLPIASEKYWTSP
ncbi:MAG TPA: hypothetical protein PKC79_12340 [Solidesulfovibrio magneticus]|nr:hypothetical protein [Solidesulfovibrio magneticus]